MLEQLYYVYILASKSGTLYIGITNDIRRRLSEHRTRIHQKSFSAKYRCTRLVYIETFPDPGEAILREKQLKRWSRKKKEWMIKTKNPHWRDLADGWHLPEAPIYE